MKTQFRKWFCKKCGKTHLLEIEQDEITTKMFCPYCNIKMYKVLDKEKGENQV